MPAASKSRHSRRSPPVGPLAGPRTGSTESRPPSYAGDGPNRQSPAAEAAEAAALGLRLRRSNGSVTRGPLSRKLRQNRQPAIFQVVGELFRGTLGRLSGP